MTIDGTPATCLWETVADCLRAATLREGLPIADAALRGLGIPLDAFVAGVAHLGAGRPGIRNALRTASFADPRSESGGESFARAAIIEEGFQIPQLQVGFRDPVDPWKAIRVDHLFTRADGSLVAGESDGMEKYLDERMLEGRTTAEVLVEERQRESHINALGITVMRYRHRDVAHPGRLARILTAFGIPRREGRDWSRDLARYRPAQLVDIFNRHGELPGCPER